MRDLADLTVLLGLGLLLTGCPPKEAKPTSSGGESRGPTDDVRAVEVPVDRGQPATRVGGGDLGVVFDLPDGWTARRTNDGDRVARAWGPPSSGVALEIWRWDGDVASLETVMERDPWAWRAAGPYEDIAAADGDPWVGTFRENGEDPRRDRVGFAWFFIVGGRGVGVVSRVPAERMERGFAASRAVVRTARAGK